MVIKLTNNLTKSEVELEVEDKGVSASFFAFDIVLPPGMDEGEYTYILYDMGTEVARGLCQIGEYQAKKETYKQKKKTVQYNG